MAKRKTPKTDGQTSAKALDANDAELKPGTEKETGRPDLTKVAEDRAASRNPRVIGADTDN